MATTEDDKKKPKPKLAKPAQPASGGRVRREGGSFENKNIAAFNDKPLGTSFQPTRASESNFITDRLRDVTNLLGDVASPFKPKPIGGGYGDYLLGSNPRDQIQPAGPAAGRPGVDKLLNIGKNALGFISRFAPEKAADPTFAEYLARAQELIQQLGGGGGAGGVSYDPQRQQLRQQAGENDARLEAMYRQLRGSIDADAPVIQKAYQDAQASTAQNAERAQQQTQGATDSANAQNMQVLQNLGIGDAQARIIQEGRDLNTQTAADVGRQAERGQAAGDRLVSNEASAVQHNTNVGNAAGLEGNLQRAANQARLQALIAELDTREADANMQAQQQSQAQGLSQALNVANQLLGFDQSLTDRNDRNQQAAAEFALQRQQMLNDQASAYDPNAFIQWLTDQQIVLPDDPYSRARSVDFYRKAYTG